MEYNTKTCLDEMQDKVYNMSTAMFAAADKLLTRTSCSESVCLVRVLRL